ncbi:MAG: ribbon-helix-helix domain-containing protein [Pseudomonadota bacterium]
MNRRPAKRSVTLQGHRTSVSLEDEFWEALKTLASEQDIAMNALVSEIDANRSLDIGLASALRLYVLRKLTDRLPN